MPSNKKIFSLKKLASFVVFGGLIFAHLVFGWYFANGMEPVEWPWVYIIMIFLIMFIITIRVSYALEKLREENKELKERLDQR